MTDEQRQKITNLRTAGNGYKKISKLLGYGEEFLPTKEERAFSQKLCGD